MEYSFDIVTLGVLAFLVMKKYLSKIHLNVAFVGFMALALVIKYVVLHEVILDKKTSYGDLNYLSETELYLLPNLRFGAALYYPIWAPYFRTIIKHREKTDKYFPLHKRIVETKEECNGDFLSCAEYVRALTAALRVSIITDSELRELNGLLLDKKNESQITCDTYGDFSRMYDSVIRANKSYREDDLFVESFTDKTYELAMNCASPTSRMIHNIFSKRNVNKSNFKNVYRRVCSSSKAEKACNFLNKLININQKKPAEAWTEHRV